MKSKKLIWTRFAVALLVFAMALGLAACVKSKEQSSATGSDRKSVVSGERVALGGRRTIHD